MDNGLKSVTEIVTLIIGVAIISVLVSSKAQTGSIITSAGNALTSLIKTAVSPVTG